MDTTKNKPIYLYTILGWSASATSEGCAPLEWGTADEIAVALARDENGPEAELPDVVNWVNAACDLDTITGRNGWVAKLGRRLNPSADQRVAVAAVIREHLDRWAGLDWATDLSDRTAEDLEITEDDRLSRLADLKERVTESAAEWRSKLNEAAVAIEQSDFYEAAAALVAASTVESEYGYDPVTQAVLKAIAQALGVRPINLIDELRRAGSYILRRHTF